jgi:hypothetical protein
VPLRTRFVPLTAALSVVLVGLVLAGAFVVVRGYPGEIGLRLSETGPSAAVQDLHGIDQLATAFNDSAGTPRLVVLFSPT